MEMLPNGTGVRPIATNQGSPSSIADNDGTVDWTNTGSGEIMERAGRNRSHLTARNGIGSMRVLQPGEWLQLRRLDELPFDERGIRLVRLRE
jgi:hypothetical protein